MVTVEDIFTKGEYKFLRKNINTIINHYYNKYFIGEASMEKEDFKQKCFYKLCDLEKKCKLKEIIVEVKNKKGEIIYPLLNTTIKNFSVDCIRALKKDPCLESESLEFDDSGLIKNIGVKHFEYKKTKKIDAQELIFFKYIYNKGFIVNPDGLLRSTPSETFEPGRILRLEFIDRTLEILKTLKPFDREVLQYSLLKTSIRKKMAADLKTNTNRIKRAELRIWKAYKKQEIESKYKDNPEERDYKLKELEYTYKASKTGKPQAYLTGK